MFLLTVILKLQLHLIIYRYFVGTVALGISTYEPLSEKEIDLFNRFLKVFERTYTRFFDLKKQKHRLEKHRLKLLWKKFEVDHWPCITPMSLKMLLTPCTRNWMN